MNIELIFGLALGASTGLLGLGVGVFFGKRYGELCGLEAAKFVKSFQDAGAKLANPTSANIGGLPAGHGWGTVTGSQGDKTLDFHRQQMLELQIKKQQYEMDQQHQAIQQPHLHEVLYADIVKGKLHPVKK